ncbi:MAG: hypothetical protein CVV22_00775 [Ignavibacteriae bacterium HGW-Ignavibacteriae-1]|jgi:uncharacterized protein YegL|nr:MAG: hypothetical protein CVV22_00775 [Ignavibacteriae bacterium HGW-Ignavibacteriae-1]
MNEVRKMKKSLLLLIFFIPGILLSQSLSLFDVDVSNFPRIRAKFYAFDADGNQIRNLSPSDFELLENGVQRAVTNLSCPAPKPPIAISSVLTIDISRSMLGQRLENAKAASRTWVDGLSLGKSECALTTFNSTNYFIQDFTTDRNKLLNAIQKLNAGGGTDFNSGFIYPMAGALIAAENGLYKKVVVFITDGQAGGNESEIIQKAKSINATVFCVTIGFGCPAILRNIATETGGLWYGSVTTKEQVDEIIRTILNIAKGGEPCEIEWESGISCKYGLTNVELQIPNLGSNTKTSYQNPISAVAKLEFNPNTVKFLNSEIGVTVEEKVTVTAINADFTVTNITSSNVAFTITPTSFVLDEGESTELTVSFTPTDSSYNFCTFNIESDPCQMAYYAIGGYKGIKPTIQTLKLTHPNGGEIFVVGSDTIITWEGIPPSDNVVLEYSIDNGQNWQLITRNANGFKHKWTNIPRPTSEQCLIRVSQGGGLLNSDPNDHSPQVEWQKTFGGSGFDIAYSIQETSDVGYIVAGSTWSKDGDITENKGMSDVWILKLKFDGTLEWQKTYGGSKQDGAYSMQETSDGGYIVAGITESYGGDISQKNGSWDLWVLKLSTDGKIEWEKTYGGSGQEGANSIQETRDGGYIVAGYTGSKNGDIIENKGWWDMWVLKLSIDGTLEWQKTFGGSGRDHAQSILQTIEGGYIVAGYTSSNDGDVTEKNGIFDVWVLKLGFDGNIEWQKTYGGSLSDTAQSIQVTSDGGYIVAGYSTSNDGDVTENKGQSDLLVLKLRIDGSIEWQKTYGGSDIDRAYSIQEALDGGYIVTGHSFSIDGDVTENKGSSDIWLLKLRTDGSIEWQKTFGESESEVAKSVKVTSDGGYIIAGSTALSVLSSGGSGLRDVWVIKLAGGTVLQSDVSDAVFSIVEPIASSRDIDMEQVLVGSTKDSVISEFVSNVGSWKFRVDSIYIQGADASAFSLVAGFPEYTIEPNDSYFGEFRFVPNRVGIHRAEIVIVTQAETIIQNIIGEGVQPRLEVITDFLDFGQVEIGSERTISDTVLIKNISSSPITIDDVVQLGPDMAQFKIISGGGNFTLMPNEERAMTLMFQPIFGGRTSGQLGFVYDGTGSPAVAQLFGTGIGGLVYVSNDSAYAGEKRTLSLMMSKVKPEGIASIASNFEATIRFQRTILFPENFSSVNFINDSIYVTINGTFGNSLELAEIPVIAGLGVVEETLVEIFDMKLKDQNGNYVEYDFEKQSGTFKLLGICYEGGTRLINPNSEAGILSIAPNPADDILDIVVSLIESGMTELAIYNTMGEKVLTVFSTTSPLNGIQNFNLDTKLLSTGQYYLQLRTPTHIENQIIKIVK